MLNKRICALVTLVLLVSMPLGALAHSGRTDANGGHYNRKTGEYHYHNGGKSSSSSSSSSTKKSASKVSPKISVTNMPKSMLIDESLDLDWTVDGDTATVTWASSNEDVVHVSSIGVLTARGKGTATIRASFGETEKSFKITVKPIAVDSVELSIKQILLKVGETVTLSASLLPKNASDQTLAWKSSDKRIASVDGEGNVAALAVGECTVSAIAGDVGKRSDKAQIFVIHDISQENFPIGSESDREDVISVQAVLIMLGDLAGKADGKYGRLTEAAVSAFAERAGVNGDACTNEIYSRMLSELYEPR